MSSILDTKTYDRFYNLPLRYKIEIWDPTETQRIYLSDGFDVTRSNLVVQKINVNQSQWETWNGSITIDDSVYNNLDTDIFDNGVVMKILFGKTESTIRNAFYGIVDLMGPTRSSGDKLSWDVAAKGFGVVSNYSFVNFTKIPPPETIKTGANISNEASIPFFANNLVKSLWGDLDIIPLVDYTLSERMGKGFTLDNVSNIVKDFIPGIRSPLVTASQVMNLISGMSGAIWYIDQNKQLQFTYPFGSNSGIIIKDFTDPQDSGDFISYVNDGTFAYKDSTSPDDGFTNQIFAIAEKTDLVSPASDIVNFTSLWNKDIAFAVVPGVARLSNLTFVMSKTGAGTDAANPAIAKIFGYVVPDKNNNPGDTPVASFTINVKDVTEVPSPIVKIDREDFKKLDIDKMYWIVFKERGSAEDNTIRIWHDDDFITPSTPDHPRYSAQRTLPFGGQTNAYEKDNWLVSAQGPEYSVGFATVENIMVEASDEFSIQKWSPGRPIQSRVSVPALKSVQSVQTYLNLVVQQTSQKIRSYDTLTCTIPNNFIETGTNVQVASDRIRDLAFENNRIAAVKSVSYSLDTNTYAVGTKTCSVSLRGYVSPLD